MLDQAKGPSSPRFCFPKRTTPRAFEVRLIRRREGILLLPHHFPPEVQGSYIAIVDGKVFINYRRKP